MAHHLRVVASRDHGLQPIVAVAHADPAPGHALHLGLHLAGHVMAQRAQVLAPGQGGQGLLLLGQHLVGGPAGEVAEQDQAVPAGGVHGRQGGVGGMDGDGAARAVAQHVRRLHLATLGQALVDQGQLVAGRVVAEEHHESPAQEVLGVVAQGGGQVGADVHDVVPAGGRIGQGHHHAVVGRPGRGNQIEALRLVGGGRGGRRRRRDRRCGGCRPPLELAATRRRQRRRGIGPSVGSAIRPTMGCAIGPFVGRGSERAGQRLTYRRQASIGHGSLS